MGNEEANIALSMELEEAIKQRVLDIIKANSFNIARDLSFNLYADDTFIREMTRRIGSKMSSNY